MKLVRQLGSSLTGMTYFLDEPSVELHPHDVHRLDELVQIRDQGNTVLVVEHEPDVTAVGDHVPRWTPAPGGPAGRRVRGRRRGPGCGPRHLSSEHWHATSR